MNSALHAVAELVALRFLDALAEGTFVCLIAGFVLRLTPRQNAGTRFAVWFTALVGIAALPWIGEALPHPGFATAAARPAAVLLPRSWAIYILALWGAIAFWFAIGIVRAIWHLNILRRACIPIDTAALDAVLRETLERHGSGRIVALCTSEQVRVPTAVGLFKPAILIPSWVMREFSPVELNQVLLHELAHFRRWDDWTNLAQQIVKAIFFFHPAVWWLDRKIAVEREIACDDAVLAETRRPRAYAECLAHLAEKSFVRRSVALAQAALGHVRQTSARIAQILNVNRTASTRRSWGPAVSIVAVLALGCGVLYSRTSGLVAFGNAGDSRYIETAKTVMHIVPDAGIRHPLEALPAKLSAHSTPAYEIGADLHRSKATAERTSPAQFNRSARSQNKNLVHLTTSRVSNVPVTETYWIVVQSEAMNPVARPVYQIQMWRVTVFRTVIGAPNRLISRSET